MVSFCSFRLNGFCVLKNTLSKLYVPVSILARNIVEMSLAMTMQILTPHKLQLQPAVLSTPQQPLPQQQLQQHLLQRLQRQFTLLPQRNQINMANLINLKNQTSTLDQAQKRNQTENQTRNQLKNQTNTPQVQTRNQTRNQINTPQVQKRNQTKNQTKNQLKSQINTPQVQKNRTILQISMVYLVMISPVRSPLNRTRNRLEMRNRINMLRAMMTKPMKNRQRNQLNQTNQVILQIYTDSPALLITMMKSMKVMTKNQISMLSRAKPIQNQINLQMQ